LYANEVIVTQPRKRESISLSVIARPDLSGRGNPN